MRRFLALFLVAVAAAASLLVGTPARPASAATSSNTIVWYNANSRQSSLSYMNGSRASSSSPVLARDGNIAAPGPEWTPAGSGDMNGDGQGDMLWYNTVTHRSQVWFMNDNRVWFPFTVLWVDGTAAAPDSGWRLVGNADMNADGKADMLWYHTTAHITSVWLMNGNRVIAGQGILNRDGTSAAPAAEWQLVGNGDMNGDGQADLLWYNTITRRTQVWFMNGNRVWFPFTVLWVDGTRATPGPEWRLVGNGDMNADGKADMLWYHTTAHVVSVWLMNGNRVIGNSGLQNPDGKTAVLGPEWKMVGIGRFNQPTGVDNYPFSPTICGHTGNCSGTDPWGFTKQQCVSFVAWRLSQRGVRLDGAAYGDAANWDDAAVRRGITVNSTPRVGDVAQWNANEKTTAPNGSWVQASPQGHVAYVTAVNADGTVNVEEYNSGGDRSYHQRFSITAGRYIHF